MVLLLEGSDSLMSLVTLVSKEDGDKEDECQLNERSFESSLGILDALLMSSSDCITSGMGD